MKKKPATKGKKNVPREISPRARLFVAEYQKDLNGTQAAIRAGFSARTAAQQASRLLTNVKVAAAIEASVKQREEKALSDVDWLKKRLREEAEADIADLYYDDDTLKPIHLWPPVWRKGLVTGIEIEEHYDDDEEAEVEFEPQPHGGALKRAVKPRKATGRMVKVKHSDRIKRLELYGRHVDVQAWKDRKEVSADEPLTKLFEQIAGQSVRPREDGAA